MDNELKQYLEGMEGRISSRVDAMEGRINASAEVREERINSRAETMEERINARIEKPETALLSPFHGWSRSMEIRVRVVSAVTFGFDERLAHAEERISELERRKAS